MSIVRTSYLNLVFSTFLVAFLLKVPKIAIALPLADLCKLSGFSIDGSNLANLDIPRLLFQAADTPKKSAVAADKIKEVGEEVVEKIKEFYDLLAESELILEEEESQNVIADGAKYLAPRSLDTEGFSVQNAIANEVRNKDFKDAASDFESDDNTRPVFEFERDKTDTLKLQSDKPNEKLEPDELATESKFADATIPESESQNAGSGFKQMTADTTEKFQQFVDENIRKPVEIHQKNMKNAGDSIKRGTGQVIRKLKHFYETRLKAAGKFDPETGALLGDKGKKTFGQKFKQIIQDKVKNPILKFLNFKVQLDVNVKPIS